MSYSLFSHSEPTIHKDFFKRGGRSYLVPSCVGSFLISFWMRWAGTRCPWKLVYHSPSQLENREKIYQKADKKRERSLTSKTDLTWGNGFITHKSPFSQALLHSQFSLPPPHQQHRRGGCAQFLTHCLCAPHTLSLPQTGDILHKFQQVPPGCSCS